MFFSKVTANSNFYFKDISAMALHSENVDDYRLLLGWRMTSTSASKPSGGAKYILCVSICFVISLRIVQ